MAQKIEQVANKYEINSEELEEKHKNGRGLRPLETHWNKRIVRSAVREQGEYLTEREAEALVDALQTTDDEVVESVEARTRLRELGVDVDDLVDDLTSYQTIRHHLKERGVDTSRTREVRPEKEVDTILRLQHRLEKVSRRSIQRSNQVGQTDIADPSVSAAVTVKCGACGGEWILPNVIAEGVSCGCSL